MNAKTRDYFDHNATAPLKAAVRDLMITLVQETGNASSLHGEGRAARTRVETAREQVAALVKTQSAYVTFTSGATESNNAVIKTFAGERILLSAIEHPSILEAAPAAEKIPVTKDGVINEAAFEALLDTGTAPALISIMLVNNETGVIQPVEKLARLARKKHPGVYIHCDAVQAAGRLDLDFAALQIDYMSLSAHKMGGPQGVGALITAPGARPAKLLHGGGQEKRQRAGTENVIGIAAFGLAAELADKDRALFEKLAEKRDALEAKLKAVTPSLIVIGAQAPRVANTSNISLPGVAAQTILMSLDLEGTAISSGSACSSGTVKSSHVLEAMQLSPDEIKGALRISFGWDTDDAALDRLVAVWSKITPRFTTK